MAAVASSSLALSNPGWLPRFPSILSPSLLPSQAPIICTVPPIPSLCLKTSLKSPKLHLTPRKGISWTALRFSATESPSSVSSSEKWLLEPIGDGNSRHLGYSVPLPDAFEIASSVVTVGGLPEKADVVIPVPTVSGVHARLERKDGALLVIDLDSTNGTYIDDKRLKPGVATTISPESRITFGDIHLAMYRVSKLETDVTSKADESETQGEAAVPADNLETAS